MTSCSKELDDPLESSLDDDDSDSSELEADEEESPLLSDSELRSEETRFRCLDLLRLAGFRFANDGARDLDLEVARPFFLPRLTISDDSSELESEELLEAELDLLSPFELELAEESEGCRRLRRSGGEESEELLLTGFFRRCCFSETPLALVCFRTCQKNS